MFEISLPAGKYIVAVSGGIDSMVLLDVLAKLPQLTLVVAHFEHGIRADSDLDRQLVQTMAVRYQVPFVYERGELGPAASEATARHARYAFLERVRVAQGAQAIVTAHHQDDMLETAIINMVRGTGRKGLSALGTRQHVIRPLLHVPKAQIIEYAAHFPDIIWRDDTTNTNERYLRNYIRRHVLSRLDRQTREQLLQYITAAYEHNPVIDRLLGQDIARHSNDGALDRAWFIALPYAVSCEVLAAWLRQAGMADFDRKAVERLVVLAKVGQAGKRGDVGAGYWLEVGKDNLKLKQQSSS